MPITRRDFLRSSLGAAVSQKCAGAAARSFGAGSGTNETTSSIPFGSGDFGRWSQDEFGLPLFCYTANQTVEPSAVTDVRPGILSAREHIHQVGNDRITALASNYGTVRVRQDEGGPKILNDIDPEAQQFGGGLGYLTDGHETLSTYYDGSNPRFERIFGVGYFRKRLNGANYGIDQVVTAPFGDDPVLLSQVTITNHSSTPAHLRWVEYWGCQPYQLSLRAWMESFSDPGKAAHYRRDMGRRFSHEFEVLAGNRGMRERKHFEGRSAEEERAWIETLKHGNAQGFFTPVQAEEPGTCFENTNIPDTFLVALDGPVSGTSSGAQAFFATGGPMHPEGLQRQLRPTTPKPAEPGALLLERSFELAPGANRTLYFLYGYLPKGSSLSTLVSRYQATATRVWAQTCQAWKEHGVGFQVDNEPWVERESKWNYYYLRSARSYDDFFGEHLLNQNGFYQYTMGFQGAPRDPLQHALPFLFSDPEILKEVLRYTLKEVRADGSLPYAMTGHGVVAPMLSDRASDLPLWLLWAVSEYVLATRDVLFLHETVPARLSPKLSASDSVANLLQRCYEHQVRDVGVGEHGIVRMLVDDWNDGLIYTWANSDLQNCIETSESVLNGAMSAWVFDKYAQMLAYAGESAASVTHCRAEADRCRSAVAAQWNGRWFRRAWLGEQLGWLGESTLWMEPQPWALLSGAASEEQGAILVRNIDQLLRQGPLGARQMSNGPDMKGSSKTDRGTLEAGAIWPSLNQTLVWALADRNPAMAWQEWKRNTLAHHAEACPHLWYGVWSGNDSYNTPDNSNPGGAANQPYFRGTDFPVFNLHAHACFLYSASKLLGLNFDQEGMQVNLRLPEEQFRFDSALVSVAKTRRHSQTLFEGSYKPLRPGNWTIRILLDDGAMRSVHHAEVNGESVLTHPASDGSIVLKGKSTVHVPLLWKVACASQPVTSHPLSACDQIAFDKRH